MIRQAPSYRRAAAKILKEYPSVQHTEDTSFKRSVWLDEGAIYINRETGRRYQPHNADEADFVYMDWPRRWCLKGGEGCVAAETLIEGVPAAEWYGGEVTTLYGHRVASKAYLKGRADLYRVRTDLGREVVVTGDHRFLTPVGWSPLRDLAVGSLVASYDTDRGHYDSERSRDSSSHCLMDFRPCDELPIPMAVDVRGKLLQHLSVGLHLSTFFDQTREVCYCHLCSWNSVLSMLEFELPRSLSSLIHQLFADDTLLRVRLFQLLFRFQEHSYHSYTSLLFDLCLYLAEISSSVYAEVQENRAICTLSDRIYLARLESPERELHCCTSLSVSEVFRHSSFCSLHASPFFVGLSDDHAPNYNTYWGEIQRINFVKNGDYYDLSVPGVEHYAANGIWHHNSGKSVAGIIKALERARRGMSGIMGSPNFVHLKKSLLPELKRWCPINALIPKHRYRLGMEWEPNQPFNLIFVNGASVLVGGFDSPYSWEGPNVNWAHFDEARHHANGQMAKVLDGRCRISGPHGEPPQWWLTSTPRKSRMSNSPDDSQYHWMYEMFGPWTDQTKEDPFAAFKRDSRVTTLRLEENIANLSAGYVESRPQSLTASEESILVDAEWADEESLERFLRSILLWDACREELPPLGKREPLVIALDAATGRTNSASDCFTIDGITLHPKDKSRYALRISEEWSAATGREIDFIGTELNPGPETRLRQIIKDFNVVCVCFDPHQLINLAQRIEVEEGVWCDKFGQVAKRLESDRSLLDDIVRKNIAHNGNPVVRSHMDNADRKVDDFGSKFRIVKGRGRVDHAVCISMALWQIKNLSI